MDSDLLSSKEYPTALRNRFILDYAALFGDHAEGELRALGAYCARRDLGGIYRVFLMHFSTSRTLETFAGLWRRYQNTGEAKITEKAQNFARLEIRDENNTSLHSQVVAGYVAALLEMTGAKSVSVGCQHPEGSPLAVFEGRWK